MKYKCFRMKCFLWEETKLFEANTSLQTWVTTISFVTSFTLNPRHEKHEDKKVWTPWTAWKNKNSKESIKRKEKLHVVTWFFWWCSVEIAFNCIRIQDGEGRGNISTLWKKAELKTVARFHRLRSFSNTLCLHLLKLKFCECSLFIWYLENIFVLLV